jgi:dTDP-4-dehydrorhamnose 3,5-epimerase
MQLKELDIPGVKILTPTRHRDGRGFFSEIYNVPEMVRLGIRFDFVQENYSFSERKYTVRGLHAQSPPFAQSKLVQVLTGAILDVAVDLRRGSPWYGKFVAAELSAENWSQILIPAGFAHGFCTLTPDTAVIYKVTAPYSAKNDGGILWNDRALSIPWPATVATASVSDKDRHLPVLADYDSPFIYDGNSG